jgi:hypothetical protein
MRTKIQQNGKLSKPKLSRAKGAPQNLSIGKSKNSLYSAHNRG